MNLEDVKAEVKRIEEMAYDDECAHGAEDDLHKAVLEYYAEGGNDPLLAEEALKTSQIHFARWCA